MDLSHLSPAYASGTAQPLGPVTGAELPEGGPVRDRVDAALIRAAWGTGAQLRTFAPGALDLADGVGAVLRYPLTG